MATSDIITGGLPWLGKVLFRISNELTKQEVDKLKSLCTLCEFLTDDELENIQDATSLFKALRRKDHISETEIGLHNLKELLSLLNREDLIQQILPTNVGNSHHSTKIATQSDESDLATVSSKVADIEISKTLAASKQDHLQTDGYPNDITVVTEKTPFRTVNSSSDEKAPSASTDFSAETPSLDVFNDTSKPKLRSYQKELAKPALEGKKTIICAPTGSGKTITAAEICKHLHDRTLEPNNFKSLFIVNIRHLTSQQRAAFRTHFSAKDLGALEESDSLMAILKVKKVVMITAQILVNALENKEVELSYFDLLIFDECHHTTLNHPYNTIMRNYLMKKKEGTSRLPFILGLSASLGVGSDGDAANHIITLCANMDATCVSFVRENLKDLKQHVRTPESDKILSVNPRPKDDQFRKIIEEIMLDQECRHVGEARHDRGSQEYENWIIQCRKDAENAHNRTETVICGYLRAFNDALMLYENLRAIDALDCLSDHFDSRSIAGEFIEAEDELRSEFELNHQKKLMKIAKKENTNDCPKLKKLVELLKSIFGENKSSKGIILCRTRKIAMGLKLFLRQETSLDDDACNIKCDCLVGQGNKADMKDTMTENEQAKVLKKFRDLKINILVATDIAQEGLDMPACNVVIRFNFVSNEIGTVQSRGRARASGKCFLIVERGSRNEKHEETNREKVQRMNEALLNVDSKSEDEFKEEVVKRQKELIEEYEEELLRKKQIQLLDRATDVQVLCKECSVFLCYASDLLERGCHITCDNPEFRKKIKEIKKKKPEEYRDTTNMGTIKCADTECGQPLGSLILFKGSREHKGYGLKAQSFKFMNLKRDLNKTWTIKKWKKRTFEIKHLSLTNTSSNK